LSRPASADFFNQLLTQQNDITTLIDMMKDYRRVIPDDWQAMSKVFTALGDEHRQRILLLFEPGERLNVGQVAEVSTLSRSTVSHHLKVLREAGVLNSEKIGKEVWFWIDRDWLIEVFGNVLDYIRTST
jgi:DNA-binding transcriptional ArsR family regulator